MNSCVSVIMPVYNTKTYLGTALDSVLKQSWVDFEIIIVDDGSKDGSRALIQQYAEKYPEKIRYFFQENGGAAHARNTGLKNAKGGYVAFLDSDDLWMSNKLQIQINYFQKNPEVDLIYTNAILIDSHGNDQGELYSRSEEFDILPNELFNSILIRNFVPFSSIILKKTVIDNIGGFNVTYGNTEDMDFLLRVIREHQGQGIKQNLIMYRIHENNASRDLLMRHKYALEILLKHTSLYPSTFEHLGRKLKLKFANKYFDYGYALFANENFREARVQFFNSIRTEPFHRYQKYLFLLLSLLPLSFVRFLRNIKKNIIKRT